MGQSTLRLPDPSNLPHGERRRFVRQKLHTPAFASFNGSPSGAVVDLSELLDLHEEGFGVQTNTRLELNRALTVSLDLTGASAYIHGSGQVVWSDDTGRAGIRFSYLPEPSRRILKEWLFANLLIASTNHAARAEQIALHQVEQDREEPSAFPAPVGAIESPALAPLADAERPAAPFVPAAPALDRAALLSALDDVRRDVRALTDNAAALHVIADRAMSFTGAAGTALALLTDGAMVCRARAGDLAPPLGFAMDVKQGLSGECVRSGLAVLCQDTAADARVDPELCRNLGLGSFMAVPIFTDFRVVGLLEVFSPHPGCFVDAHSSILDRLVELVPKTEARETQNEIQEKIGEGIGSETEEVIAEEPEEKIVSRPQQPAPPETTLSAAASHFVPVVPESSPHPSAEQFDLNTVREGLWEAAEAQPATKVRAPQLEPQLSSKAAPQAEDQPSAEVPDQEPAQPASRSLSGTSNHFVHLGLLGLAIAVVAMALGYLMAPLIERRWPSLARSLASSPASPQSPSASSAGITSNSASVSSSSLPTAANRTRELSPVELLKLARQADPEAEWRLGVLFHNGEGVVQSDTQAVEWFERAADQGYVSAQATLGAYYEAGRGVPQDFLKAYFWSALAVAQGDENSKLRLQDLSARMTRSQVDEARQQAETWLHSHTQRKPPPY